MIRFQENYSLKEHNTFHIDAKARYYFEFTELEDLLSLFAEFPQWDSLPLLLLGGGSNLLLTDDFDGLVIHPKVPGIGQVNEDRNYVYLEVGAGMLWDDVVRFAVQYQLGGIENLSLIPGDTGAAAVQNIGAYGVEICDYIETVNGFDLSTLEACSLSAEQCKYAYRDSIFKRELKNRFIITSIVLRLDKFPEVQLGYGALKTEVEKHGGVSIETVRKVVIDIRNAKLPDPEELGNAGSFFMNPIVAKEKGEELLKAYPNMPCYDAPNGMLKLAAGWLIDQCGWKGYRKGDCGVHVNQALVLVNYKEATGKEIASLAEEIKQSVKTKFGVDLVPEVNYIP